MTAPNQPTPDGSLTPGDFSAFQAMTESSAKGQMLGRISPHWTNAQSVHNVNVKAPIQDTYVIAVSAQGSADEAVTEAQAAANAAANAEIIADLSYENASFWSVECVVASAEVLLGVNELLLGPVLDVPADQEAYLSDVHIALFEQHNGMTIEIRKWSDDGTTSTTITTATLIADQNRANIPALNYQILDKERFYYSVTSITGSVPPQVLQIAVAGAFVAI